MARIRRRVRQVLLLYGVSWVAGVVFGSALAVGMLDWLLHFDDPGVRLILGLGIVSVSSVIAYRCLVAPLSVKLGDRDLALRIEERYPGFKDSFASTVQFLGDGNDPRLGSPALQRHVIEKTLHQTERWNIDDIVETRSARRVATIAGIVCFVGALVIGFRHAEASIALRRLVFPFAENPWPKQTALRFVDSELRVREIDLRSPLRIASGDNLDVYFINLNPPHRLPPKVQLEYRIEGGDVVSEALTRSTLKNEAGEQREVSAGTMVVKAPLAFRAIGGDDHSMPWIPVEVVPPPAVESLHVTLTPPAYSHRPKTELPAGVGHVEGLIGTVVRIAAMANKPLKSAVLRIKEEERIPIELASDGKQIDVSFTIQEAGLYSYWLDLEDVQGFENGDAPRYEIRGIQDAVPEISIDQPAADSQVTANAVIPVRTIAKDDLGLKEIRLAYTMGETLPAEETQEATIIPLQQGAERPLESTIDYAWKLAELKLTHGAQLVFHTEATDDFDLGPEHVGRSLSRTLRIVTTEEKLQEITDRQGSLLGELERASKQQIDARAQVDEMRLQMQKAGQLRSQDLDQLQRVELQQRHITEELRNPIDGVERKTRELLRELADNKIEDAETRNRLEQIASELDRLGTDNLPVIEQELTQARKDAQGESRPEKVDGKSSSAEKREHDSAKEQDPPTAKSSPGNVATAHALERARENQLVVEESLQEVLQQLSQWRDERTAARELNELIAAQKRLNENTSEVGKDTVTKPLRELTPQQQADVARLAERQQQLAERLNQLQAKMDEMLSRNEPADPAADSSLARALEQAKQEATSARLQEAAAQIGENNVGAATGTQEDAMQKLQQMEDILRSRPETDTETLVKKMKQAEEELDVLRKRQDELLEKMEQVEQLADRNEREKQLEELRKEQAQVRQQTAQMARKLRRLRAGRSGAAADRATARMQQAESNLDKQDAEGAAKEQQEALDDIKQAQRELAQAREDAEEQLAHEKLEKVADELKAMIGREQNVIDETERLERLRAERGNLNRVQLGSLRNLAEVQRGLQQETGHLIEALEAAEVFALALKGASRQMEAAAKLLDERQTGEVTQRFERAAQKRFIDLIEVLKQDEPEKQEQQEAPQQEGEQPQRQGNPPPRERVPSIAQFKMLRAMQLELNERTRELDARRAERNPAKLTPAEEQEREALATEQGDLADLARNLMRAAAPSTDEPEAKDKVEPKEGL